ncbi:MAG TPA: metal ABC transporter permease [Micropruina sp.]|nr:metal ABC transporter permease [Propionibacterium sp.]HMQ36188.1 metal ABC transporter permease [Micropruina sp.]HMR20832.1 metal ABC transporter permease [Micropruina sp.]
MEWLALEFMQRALLAALITGLTAPAIGTYLVQRRLSLLGDGLGHLAVAGVGLAFLTGTAPLPLAVLVCVVGAIAIELLRELGRTSGDVGLAILFYGGLSGGLLLASLAGQGTGTLSAFLFGSLLTINAAELWIIGGLGAVVLLVCLGLLPQLFAVSADEPFARTIGLPVRVYNVLVVALAAVTVTVSMRTVGLLLVSALMVVPVATANHLVIGFRRSMLTAMGLGVIAAVSGTIGSYQFDTAPGALIVVIAIGLFALSWPVSLLLARRHAPVVELTDDQPPRSHEMTEEHPHVHSEGCGHRAVPHGGHVDYIHDGHRHAAHEGHYDEH